MSGFIRFSPLVLLIVPCAASGQVTVRGRIVLDSARGGPVANVQVRAQSAVPAATDGDGGFRLHFPTKRPGDRVLVRLEMTGLEVANPDRLDLFLPRVLDEQIVFVMRKAGTRDSIAASMLAALTQAITTNFAREIAIRGDSIAQLKRERDAALAQARLVASELSKVDIASASATYQAALAHFLKGEVAEARDVLDDSVLEAELAAASEREKRARQGVRQALESFMLKARLYRVDRQYTEAEQIYGRVLAADSTMFAALLELAFVRLARGDPIAAATLCARARANARTGEDSVSASMSEAVALLSVGDTLSVVRAQEAVDVLSALEKQDSTYSTRLAEAYHLLVNSAAVTRRFQVLMTAADSALHRYAELASRDSQYYVDLATLIIYRGVVSPARAGTAGNVLSVDIIEIYDRALSYLERLSTEEGGRVLKSRVGPYGVVSIALIPTADIRDESLLPLFLGVLRAQRGTVQLARLSSRSNTLYRGRIDNAMRDFDAAFEHFQSLAPADSNIAFPFLVDTYWMGGIAKAVGGDYAGAYRAVMIAREQARRLAELDPMMDRGRARTIDAYLGEFASRSGNHGRAIDHFLAAAADDAADPGAGAVSTDMPHSVWRMKHVVAAADAYLALMVAEPRVYGRVRDSARAVVSEAIRLVESSTPIDSAARARLHHVSRLLDARRLDLAAAIDIEIARQSARGEKDVYPLLPLLPRTTNRALIDSLFNRRLTVQRDRDALLAYAQFLTPGFSEQNDDTTNASRLRRVVDLRAEVLRGATRDSLLRRLLRGHLAGAWNDLSWYESLSGQFDRAIQSARRGLQVDSSFTLLRENLAIALLFAGRYDEAERTILSIKDQYYNQDRTFGVIFLDDLATMRRRGHRHPDVERIRAALVRARR